MAVRSTVARSSLCSPRWSWTLDNHLLLRLWSSSIMGVRHYILFLILNELNKKLLLDSFERLSVCSSSEWI